MRVLVFGNPLLPEDSIPIRLLPKLRRKFPEIEFVEFDPTEEIEEEAKKGIFAIDVVKGVKHVSLLTESDIDRLILGPSASIHDFDLAWNLKILKKLGILKKIAILGVPPDYPEKKALEELSAFLSTLSDCRRGKG